MSVGLSGGIVNKLNESMKKDFFVLQDVYLGTRNPYKCVNFDKGISS